MPQIFDPNTVLTNTLPEPGDSLAARKRLLEERKAELKRAMAQQMGQPQGQMVSGHYVAPSWAEQLVPVLDKAQNGYMQRSLDADTLAQGVLEKAQLRDSLTQLSGTPGQSATPFGSRDAPQQDATPATLPASGNDRRQIIARLMDNPSAGGIGAAMLQDDLVNEPARAAGRAEKAADREDRQQDRRETTAASMELKREQLAQQAEDAKRRSEDTRLGIEQRREAAQMHNALMRQMQTDRAAARANAPGKPEKVVNLTSAQQKAYDDSDALLGHIDNAIESIKTNPNSLGKKTLVPDIALAKIDPEGVQTRAAVAGLSAEKVHQLSGAAVSPAEFARLRPYLPASGDDDATASKKLTNLRAEVERIKAVHARGPTRAQPQTGGASGGWEGGGGAAPTVVRTGTLNGRKVQQMSDGSTRYVQ